MISVVIPAFNEEDSIENIIKELLDVLKKMKLPSFEIILINDGSTDNTLEITKKLNIEVISNPENIGYGFSLKRGIEKAKFETVFIIDADQTYPIEEFPKLYQEYLKGFDMVIGQRTGSFFIESSLKFFLRRILKFLVLFLFLLFQVLPWVVKIAIPINVTRKVKMEAIIVIRSGIAAVVNIAVI